MRRFVCTLVAVVFTFARFGPAAQADDAAGWLAEVREVGGLVIHVGCKDGQDTVKLCENEQILVQGIEPDGGLVAKARRLATDRGLDGRATFVQLQGDTLPYIDNLASAIVVEGESPFPKPEILRVLKPGGIGMIVKQDETRAEPAVERFIKPWPDEIDEWTHYLHGADNNAVARDSVVGAPRSIQWVGSPNWTRSHHKLNSISAVVTSGGRLFCILDEATAANINVPSQWVIMARDAFSGVTLWKKPMKSWAWHLIRFRSGPAQVTRLLVAHGDRLYAPLGLNEPVSQIDAASGETMVTFSATQGAEEMILIDETLLVLCGGPVAEQTVGTPAFRERFKNANQKKLVAIDLSTGKTRWTWQNAAVNPLPETLASDGDGVYLQIDEGVLCLDLQDGTQRWRYGDPAQKVKRTPTNFGKAVLLVSDGVVLCNLQGQLTALAAKSGEQLWECWGGGGFHAPPDVFVIDGLVWQGLHTADSISPPPVQDFNEGRDLHTGEVKRTNTVAVDLQTPGHHHRCYREKATERFIITGKRGIEMMDLHGQEHSRNNWARGTCQYGILPANGMIYAPAHSCGCYMESKLHGFWALSPTSPTIVYADRTLSAAARLERGPAFDQPVDAGSSNGDEDWPAYRHDGLRSGVASTRVAGKLTEAWATSIGGRLTQAVVSGGVAIVASIDAGSVVALDAASGEVLWRYEAGGRVDSAPTIHEGRVLFGCSDGSLTCLRLTDGQQAWRFIAAPTDMRTVAFDRVESVWPVHGSVLMLNGVAYCTAGRSTWLDGGISMYGLDPASGDVVYEYHFKSDHPVFREGKQKEADELAVRVDQNLTDYKTFYESDRSDAFSMAGGAVSDVLVSDGWNVYLHHAKFDASLERRPEMSRHLFSTSSLLDDTENHRSHWVLGTGDFSRVPVAYSWIANRPGKRMPTIAVPVAVQMVFDGSAAWGVRTQGDTVGKYLLYQIANQPFAPEEESQPDFRKVSPDQVNNYDWSVPLPFRTRAMLKAGPLLILGTQPLDIPEEDPQAAYEGRLGGSLWVGNCSDGAQLSEIKLPAPVVWDGISASESRVYSATQDGLIRCFAAGK